MKWNIIKSMWEYREPKFWSKCNWIHRLTEWRDGLYPPDEKNCICQKCHVWWAKWTHNRHDSSLPPMFVGCTPENRKGIVNEPFWYIEGEAGVKPNPEYTYGDYRKWLNGKGVALKRERYPDL